VAFYTDRGPEEPHARLLKRDGLFFCRAGFLAGMLVNDTASAVKAMGLLALGLAGRASLSLKLSI
jgi:hypothetical protein